MKRDQQEKPANPVQEKNQDNDINLSIEQRTRLEHEPEFKLQTNNTLEQYVRDVAHTYKEIGLSKENLLFDLLHVFKEKVRSYYNYTVPKYNDKIKGLFEGVEAKQGVLETKKKASVESLLEFKNRSIEDVLSLSNKAMSQTRKKKRISHILTARFIDQYQPKTLSRNKDQRMYFYQNGIYREGGRSKIKEMIVDVVGEEFGQKIMNLVISKVEGYTYMWKKEEKDFFDVNPRYLCVENGVLDLEEYTLKPHTPEKVFFEKLPVHYDPEQPYEKMEEFVKGLVTAEKDVKTLQEMFGFCLYRKYIYKKAFILLGDKNNGKSTILDILERLLGEESVSGVKLQDLSRRFQKRWIANKLANIDADLPSKAINETADFKGLTGQDTMHYEVKGGGTFAFKNYAKLIYSANELPRVDNATDAFFDRWVLVRFPYEFIPKHIYKQREENGEDMDMYKVAKTNVVEKFLSEQSLSGILNWALKGLQRLRRNDHFSQDDSVKKMWMFRTDSFKAFCHEKLEDTGSKFIAQEHLEDVYEEWCNKNNTTIKSSRRHWKTVLQNEFNALKKRKSINGERTYVWIGVKFKDERMLDKQGYANASFSKAFRENLDVEDEEDVLSRPERLKQCFEEEKRWAYEDLVDKGFSERFLEQMKTEGMLYEPQQGYLERI